MKEVTHDPRAWAALAAVGALVFALGWTLTPLDDDVAPLLAGAPALMGPALTLGFVHTFRFLAPTVALAMLALALSRRWWGALRLGAIVGAADVASGVIKDIVQKPRPDYAVVETSGYAFPSGHATVGAALAVLLVWFALRHVRGRWPVVALLAVALAWAVAQAVGRLVLGVHSLSDVVAGAGLGVSVAAAVLSASLVAERRLAARRGASQAIEGGR